MSRILRIGHYSTFLADEYGFSSKEKSVLCRAAPMHDVGKIGIPDDILQKPARLTDEEFGVIKAHHNRRRVFRGSDSEVLEAARVVALSHHEKFDGSGYPRGLQGEAIPIYGRIVALCGTP